MDRREPRIFGSSPRYPDRDNRIPEPVIEIRVDTGLKTGKLTLVKVTPERAVELAAELATNASRVFTWRESQL